MCTECPHNCGSLLVGLIKIWHFLFLNLHFCLVKRAKTCPVHPPLVLSPLQKSQPVCSASLWLTVLRRGVGHIGQYMTEKESWSHRFSTQTCKFMDCDAVEDIKGGIQLERLTASLTHKADLHGCARWLGNLHRRLQQDMSWHQIKCLSGPLLVPSLQYFRAEVLNCLYFLALVS